MGSGKADAVCVGAVGKRVSPLRTARVCTIRSDSRITTINSLFKGTITPNCSLRNIQSFPRDATNSVAIADAENQTLEFYHIIIQQLFSINYWEINYTGEVKI